MAKGANQAAVESLARELGADVRFTGVSRFGLADDLLIDAPARMVWCDNDCHVICEMCDEGKKSEIEPMFTRALERMRLGLRPCGVAECEVCFPIE